MKPMEQPSKDAIQQRIEQREKIIDAEKRLLSALNKKIYFLESYPSNTAEKQTDDEVEICEIKIRIINLEASIRFKERENEVFKKDVLKQ